MHDVFDELNAAYHRTVAISVPAGKVLADPIVVTHHIEEIPPAFTHALVLKSGSILAQGPKDKVLNSATLRRAFAVPMHVRRAHGRYWTSVGKA